MVGTRQVHVARQSWRRQPGTEALKPQGTFTKTCPDESRDFRAEGLQARPSWSAIASTTGLWKSCVIRDHDCSLAKTTSIIYITILSGTTRSTRCSSDKRALRT